MYVACSTRVPLSSKTSKAMSLSENPTRVTCREPSTSGTVPPRLILDTFPPSLIPWLFGSRRRRRPAIPGATTDCGDSGCRILHPPLLLFISSQALLISIPGKRKCWPVVPNAVNCPAGGSSIILHAPSSPGQVPYFLFH